MKKNAFFKKNRKKISGVVLVLLSAAFSEALNGNVFALAMFVLLMAVLLLTWKN